ncbi:glutathione peroxidase [Roseomonas sp. OT10]|uniref:glutathione peroxidase n=1 Tax=Roseomonas cutis TaxID=2897332 RepID=UPI001E542393|nr:glutathione peroxidase [Roseomonas sp. OT10]UFN50784.1 glutathione peroxidase [Roseomonas sp. OT10]
MAEIGRRAVLAASGAALAPFAARAQSAADFRFEDIAGGPLPLSRFAGRPLLVVNTASFCGFTRQYEGLQALHERLSPRGLVVLGVPSNDFGQESERAATIKDFCEATFGVAFPMAAPEHVTGARAHPFFAWAARQGGGPPRWNFHKYLVSRDGQRVRGFPSAVEPDAPELTRAIEAALG